MIIRWPDDVRWSYLNTIVWTTEWLTSRLLRRCFILVCACAWHCGCALSTHAHCTLWLTATSSSSSSSPSTRLCSRRRPQLGRWLDAPSVYVYLEAPAAVAVAGLIDRWRMICGNHVDMVEKRGGFGTLFVNLEWNSSFADYNRSVLLLEGYVSWMRRSWVSELWMVEL